MPNPASPAQAKGVRLAVALGDPAGIGAEVVLKALHHWPRQQPQPLLVGCRRWLEQRYDELRPLSAEPLADPAQLELLDLPLPEPVHPGQVGAASGGASFHWLSAATELVQGGACQALVTAPIAKHAWHASGQGNGRTGWGAAGAMAMGLSLALPLRLQLWIGPLQQAHGQPQVAVHPGADGHGAARVVEALAP
ncbi:MAG: 4-hydroxythreonine-4-phosphate dehydrogenase PdxA, partial [Vulcanococcus sp.]